ncbi:MAG TPA: Flp family type IVb pilin [Alphaproteobacteria bacterium]|nr:Flp family type IVb pilin [Alphaproteobacteria bacterium]
MNAVLSRFKKFVCECKAATSIEYGLIAGGISLAIILIVFAFGDNLIETYNYMVNDMTEVNDRLGG